MSEETETLRILREIRDLLRNNAELQQKLFQKLEEAEKEKDESMERAIEIGEIANRRQKMILTYLVPLLFVLVGGYLLITYYGL